MTLLTALAEQRRQKTDMTATTDFGAEFTHELRKQEEGLRGQAEQLKKTAKR